MSDRRALLGVALVSLLTAAAGVARSPTQTPAVAGREEAYRANNLGVARLEQYAYGDAAGDFRRALELEPKLSHARVNLALALLYDNQIDAAAREADRAVAELPSEPRAHYVRGLAARLQNRAAESAAAFARVLEIDAGDVGSLIYLGQSHLQAGRFGDAVALFRKAIEAEPHNATAAYNLAVALTRSGAREDGQRAMQAFQRLRDSTYAVTYAQVYLEQGRYGEAVASTGAEPDLVAAATPEARFTNVTDAWLPGISFDALPPFSATAPKQGSEAPLSFAANGSLVLLDLDRDGDLDLLAADPRRLRGFGNDGRGRFAEISSALGFDLPADAVLMGLVAADLDNDSATDLVVLTSAGVRMLRRDGARFRDMTREMALPPGIALARTAALLDADHDGDLDVLVAGSATGSAEPAGSASGRRSPAVPASGAVQLLRNNGNLTFSDITTEARVEAFNHARAIVPTDWDNRRDIDVLVLSDAGPFALGNARDGTFRRESGLFDVGPIDDADFTAATAADVNKDGFVDFFLARANAPGHFGMSDGAGRLVWSRAPPSTAGALTAMFVDYDADGLLDLFLTRLGPEPLLLRNAGGSGWRDVTEQALGGGTMPSPGWALAVGDLDGDGDQDVLIRSTLAITALRNDDRNARHSTAVALQARVSNRSAAGARVEMRAGSLRQRLEVSATSPAIAPADLIFGLGARDRVDVVRVLWPAGILQAELDVPSPAGARLADRTLTVVELDRKPSSCPYLFTWNGERFEFITDFLGGGEMGAWMSPGVRNVPDPEEFVRVTADRLKPRNGRLELRISNELEEALFLDRVRLLAVDHAASVEVFPDEGLTAPPFKPLKLYAVTRARAPVLARDEGGTDVASEIATIDRRFVESFALLPIRGYAAEHGLTLDVGPRSGEDVLLLTGWTDYAFSSDNVAASQAGLRMSPPRLERRARGGTWVTVSDRVGFPVGRPQTLVVPLPPGGREFRLVTNMRIYWDEVRVASVARGAPFVTSALEPLTADLAWRGYSAEMSPDGREPFAYDYHRVSSASPWKTLPGSYTREGEVKPLLQAADDMFVVARSGDALALAFDATRLPALAPGHVRTYLLQAHGYSKEMDINSSAPDEVAPLPFRLMTAYPGTAGESYPATASHREYRNAYNTRRVPRSVAPIDVTAAGEGTPQP